MNAASDTTGENACPIWMRITAFQIAAPFEAESNFTILKRAFNKKRFAGQGSMPMRRKGTSLKFWRIVNGVLYEYPSEIAIKRRLRGLPLEVRGCKWKAFARGLKEALGNGYNHFIVEDFYIYIKKPEWYDNCIEDIGA